MQNINFAARYNCFKVAKGCFEKSMCVLLDLRDGLMNLENYTICQKSTKSKNSFDRQTKKTPGKIDRQLSEIRRLKFIRQY